MGYKVADMITGYGVSKSVEQYYQIWGGSIAGKRVIVQGWGNVGAAAAFYAAQAGAKVVGIIDRNGGIMDAQGLSFDAITQLFLNRQGNQLVSDQMISFDEINQKIWSMGAEVFLPCAASRLVTQDQVDQLIQHGLEVIACGANVPFADQEIFFGPIAQMADQKVSIIPDFIANCGMARVFAYLMSSDLSTIDDAAIFEDTYQIIGNALKEIHQINASKNNITASAFDIALRKLNV